MNDRNRDGEHPGHIRITGGSLRGSRLAVPSLSGLRPTPERLRQTLFDWLSPRIAGARVLDAFAGTGALGIEALSRGADIAVFFERDGQQARTIESDLTRLHQNSATVVCADALQRLATPAPEAFDIVFVDPPFTSAVWAETAALLDAHGWLARDAWVYVEAGKSVTWGAPVGWQVHRERAAGAVRGTLYRVRAD